MGTDDVYSVCHRFRWIYCQLEVLQHCLPRSIRRTLKELPRSLDETYERVLKEISTTNRDLAHRLLQCLVVAIRPLHIKELAEILALDFDGGDSEGTTPELKAGWRLEDRQRAVLSTCSSLITVVDDRGSRVIQFSHFSVKEFLTSDRLAKFKGDVSHFHIMPEHAHTTLTLACLGVLLQLDGRTDRRQVEGRFPLARYAAQHWMEHARFGNVSSSSLVQDGMRRLFDSDKPFFAAWLQLHNIDSGWLNFIKHDWAPGSPLYYASLCGFRDLAAHIIVEHPEQVNARCGVNHSPLAAALHKRHFEVAELLYQHGAVVDVTGYDNRTPLQTAAIDGLPDVARWLLTHGANANWQEDDHRTPLSSAAVHGQLEVVRMLLGHGVHVDLAGKYGHTPLHRASLNGHVAVVELLLRFEADISAQDEDGSTPLHLASSHGRFAVARLLLDHGANLNAKNKDGRTPLHQASSTYKAQRGPPYGAPSEEMVRLLLDRGADADAESSDGRTALHLASSEGRTEIVRVLLDHGANADAKDKEGRTPIEVAIQQIRIEHGA